MRHDRITVSRCIGEVASRDVEIWAFDTLGAHNPCIVRDIQPVISHEQIIVSVLEDDLRRLAPLPAGRVAGTHPRAETLGQVREVVRPGVAQVLERHSRGRIQLQQRKTAVPGAIDQVMLPVGYDVSRIDGIIIEIGVVPSGGRRPRPATLSLVGRRAGHETVVGPVARLR